MNLSYVWLGWDQATNQAWAGTKPIDTVGYRHCKKLLWDQSLKIYIKIQGSKKHLWKYNKQKQTYKNTTNKGIVKET